MIVWRSIRRLVLPIFGSLLLIGVVARPGGADPKSAGANSSTTDTRLTVEISDVPHELTLPLSDKQNSVLTATIRGATPTAVWIGRDVDSKYVVPIPPAGDDRYQFNLGDKDLLRALRRSGNNGQFRVFARNAGQTVGSVPISFELAPPASARFFAVINGSQSDVRWAKADHTSAIVLDVYPSLPGTVPIADAGGMTWPLPSVGKTTDDEGEEFSLPLTTAIRQAWEKSGVLRVRTGGDLHQPNGTIFHLIPATLPDTENGLPLWVAAKSSVVVPGSNGYLSITCGEVTPDSANLELVRADAPRIDPELAVGALRAFRLGNNQYAWGPTRIGYLGKIQSRVRVTIWGGGEAEHKVIERMPVRMAAVSSLAMTFNGKSYDGQHAGNQLNELMAKSNVTTVKQLLGAVRLRERDTNSKCKVFGSRGERALSAWIMDELSDMGWDVKPSDAEEKPGID